MSKVDKPTVFRAIREKIATEAHGDPAPWVDGNALVELWGGTEEQHKLDAATKIAFLSGLLNGAIVAIAEVDGKWLAVPGWYWAFSAEGWPISLCHAAGHFRCSECGSAPAHIGPIER